MYKLSFTDKSFSIGDQQYQKGTIAQIYWDKDGTVQIRVQFPGRTYKAHFSEFTDENGIVFDSQAELKAYISDNFFFDVSGNAGLYLSATDPRIPQWDYTKNRFRYYIHDTNYNYSYWEAIDSQSYGGGVVSGQWAGWWTVAIPTIGERMKIRGFYFSSFEHSNQSIYTRLRATGSPSIDTPDQWYRMWTEKELPESKMEMITGILYGGYNPVVISPGAASVAIGSTNFAKVGNVVMLSISLNFMGLEAGIDNYFSFNLPVLSSYLGQHFNAQYSFSDSNTVSNLIIQKSSTDMVDISFTPMSESNKLELEIKYRI